MLLRNLKIYVTSVGLNLFLDDALSIMSYKEVLLTVPHYYRH